MKSMLRLFYLFIILILLQKLTGNGVFLKVNDRVYTVKIGAVQP